MCPLFQVDQRASASGAQDSAAARTAGMLACQSVSQRHTRQLIDAEGGHRDTGLRVLSHH